MKNFKKATLPLSIMLMLGLPACTESGSSDHGHAHGDDTHVHEETAQPKAASEDTHVHADGSTHAAHDDAPSTPQDTHVHADGTTHAAHGEGMQDGHMEMPLEPVSIGGMSVVLTQNHGPVNAGQEEHLIVRITENGDEITGVRAWIGSEDRTMSYVGKGEYSLLSDAYDIHTMAPDPLPENAMWWIEIEMSDGTKLVGSAKPIL